MKTAIYHLLALFFFISYGADGKIPQSNTEERKVGEYDAVYISGWFDVNLVEGKEGTITLEGKKNTIEHINTEVKNGKLIIEWDKDVKMNLFNSKVRITVPVESIDAVKLSGSGSVKSNNTIRSESFESTLSGSGTLDLNVETSSMSSTVSGSGNTILSGQTSYYKVQVSGSGDIKAYNLKAEDVSINISGSAKIRVHANTSITSRISGSGSVYYMGDAKKIDSKVSGSGSISKG